MTMILPALSIPQPWAWAIMHADPIKDVENRSWKYPPRFRGQCLIHAGHRFDSGAFWSFNEIGLKQYPGTLEYERGGIVGIMEISDVVTEHPSPWYNGAHGTNSRGEPCTNWGLVIRNARPLPFRKLNGALGFFDVDVTALGLEQEVTIARAA